MIDPLEVSCMHGKRCFLATATVLILLYSSVQAETSLSLVSPDEAVTAILSTMAPDRVLPAVLTQAVLRRPDNGFP